MGLFSWLNKSKYEERCIFCGKAIGAGHKSELKYEALDDNGHLAEFTFGDVCTACADVLDKSDAFTDMVEDDGEGS